MQEVDEGVSFVEFRSAIDWEVKHLVVAVVGLDLRL